MGTEANEEMTAELPPELCCPLSGVLFKDPVIASNGKVYDRPCLEKLYIEQSVSEDKGIILLPDGSEIKNKFIPDQAMKARVVNFLKENPDFNMPLSIESKEHFIAAVSSNNKNQMHLSACKEPALLTMKLFGEKNVFQHLQHIESKASTETLCYLLEIAKTQWSSSQWYGFFENHIANGGKLSLIVSALLHNLLQVNDTGFLHANTLLHLAAKYGHKELAEWLIVEGNADTYLENAQGKRAKQIALSGSGIAQLIRDHLNKRAIKQFYEQELNERIKNLEAQNSLMRTELERKSLLVLQEQENVKKLESQIAVLNSDLGRKELLSAQSQQELNEKIKKLELQVDVLKNDQTKANKSINNIRTAHQNFVELARQKGFFAVKGRLIATIDSSNRNSTISIKKIVQRCSYDESDFSKVDTYVTLSGSEPRYRAAYFEKNEFEFLAGFSSSDEDKDYLKSLADQI